VDAIRVRVSLPDQRLYLLERGEPVTNYPVSTASNGPGELNGSGCTPRGLHAIRVLIGGAQPLNAVFVGRRPTGEIYTPRLGARFPTRDWILTRIIWLGGLEPGRNRLGDRDTLRRYIYIHGCPDELAMGLPLSHGCIRMRNLDVIDLFDRVRAGDTVLIED
jgi:hypothetical protein